MFSRYPLCMSGSKDGRAAVSPLLSLPCLLPFGPLSLSDRFRRLSSVDVDQGLRQNGEGGVVVPYTQAELPRGN